MTLLYVMTHQMWLTDLNGVQLLILHSQILTSVQDLDSWVVTWACLAVDNGMTQRAHRKGDVLACQHYQIYMGQDIMSWWVIMSKNIIMDVYAVAFQVLDFAYGVCCCHLQSIWWSRLLISCLQWSFLYTQYMPAVQVYRSSPATCCPANVLCWPLTTSLRQAQHCFASLWPSPRCLGAGIWWWQRPMASTPL